MKCEAAIINSKMSNSKIQEVVAIMDRSGSMVGKVEDAVGGFNSTLEVLRQELTDDSTINVFVKIFPFFSLSCHT